MMLLLLGLIKIINISIRRIQLFALIFNRIIIKILSNLMGFNMHLVWDNNSNFIFNSWQSESDGGLVLGIFLSFIVAFFSVSFNFFKDRVLTGTRVKLTISYVITYAIKLLIMFLLMCMNGWVCGIIILGITFGQLGFQYLSRVKGWKQRKQNNSSQFTEQKVQQQ